ncbi:MAG: VIT domain-containing protein [Pseudomonadota bacterium]
MSYRNPSSYNMAPGVLALIVGSVFPTLVILIELITGLCAGSFFDPMPTLGHIVLVASVPAINSFLWRATQREGASRPALIILGGAAMGIAAGYALVFLPMLPIALVAIILFGFGLLPFAPVGSLIVAIRLTNHLAAWTEHSGRRIATGVMIGFAALIAVDAPVTATYLAVGWWQGNTANQQRAVSVMRMIGDRDVLFRLGNGDTGRAPGVLSFISTSWQSGGFGAPRTSTTAARELYYRITGTAFSAVDSADNEAAARRANLFDWDEDQGGTSVGARVKDLALTESRIDGSISGADSLAYVEWTGTVTNHGNQQGEARLTLALPEGAVASRATLWVNGEPREASIGGRAETRAAYTAVVQRRRDPLLVTTDGAGRLLVQAFPIEPNASMQFRIGMSAPLAIARDGSRTLSLPAIVERNFDVAIDQPHNIWVEGDTPISTAAALTPSILDGKAGVTGTITEADYVRARPQLRIAPLTAPSFRSGVIPATGKQPSITVTQRIERALVTRPNALAIVVDGSIGNKVAADALAAALDTLPHGVSVSLRIAAEQPVTVGSAPWNSAQRALIRKALSGTDFSGGQDNIPAVSDAIAETHGPDAILLWIHGPQPVRFDHSSARLDQMLERSTSLPHLVRYQANAGPAMTEEGQPWFDTARFVSPTADPVRDLRDLLDDVAQSGAAWRVTRTAEAPGSAMPGSIHIARLWAAGEAIRALKDKEASRNAAILLARQANIVTPISGAVVLETDADYQSNGLAVPDADAVPTIPEPHEWALLAIVAAFLAWLWRRHRSLGSPQVSALA